MKLLMILVSTMFVCSNAFATIELANNHKRVVCSADDNQSWVLNAQRTTVKYTVEGESLGALKITKKNTDGKTFVSYTTEVGILTLGIRDTFLFEGDSDESEIECK